MTRFMFPEDFFESNWIEEAFQEMDRIWAHVGTGFPPTDLLVEKDTGETILRLAIAGYDRDSISVTTDNDSIIIEGEAQKKEDKYAVISQGIKASNFKARYPMSNKFDLSKIEASFVDGILTIKVPVAEEKKPKKIEIKF